MYLYEGGKAKNLCVVWVAHRMKNTPRDDALFRNGVLRRVVLCRIDSAVVDWRGIHGNSFDNDDNKSNVPDATCSHDPGDRSERESWACLVHPSR